MSVVTTFAGRSVRRTLLGRRLAGFAVLLVAAAAAAGQAIPVVERSPSGLGATAVFASGTTESVALRDSRGAIYVFAVQERRLAVMVSRDGGRTFAACGVARAARGTVPEAAPIPAEHLAAASSGNMLATVYVSHLSGISAVRLLPGVGPTLFPLEIGSEDREAAGAEITDLYVGSEPVARHFLVFLREGRLEWRIVDPVDPRSEGGVVEMPGTVVAILATSDHPESACRLHVVVTSCRVEGTARTALVAIDADGSVYLQSDRCLGEAGLLVASLDGGVAAVYGASGGALRMGSVAREGKGKAPELRWDAEVVLGFEPSWLRGYASPLVGDAFCLAAGDGSRIAVLRVETRGGAWSLARESAGEATGASLEGVSLGLHRLEESGGALRMQTDLVGLSGSGPETRSGAAGVMELPAAGGGGAARLLVDTGSGGIVWRQTHGPRVLVQEARCSVLVRTDPGSGEPFVLALPFPGEDLYGFEAPAGLDGELLLDSSGGGVLVRLFRDEAGEIRSAACTRFATYEMGRGPLLLLRCLDGSVWVMAD